MENRRLWLEAAGYNPVLARRERKASTGLNVRVRARAGPKGPAESLPSGAGCVAAGARRSVKYRAIEAPVLDRFEQMRRFDLRGPREVGDGSRDFQDAVIGAG